jgi:hypothetical protein
MSLSAFFLRSGRVGLVLATLGMAAACGDSPMVQPTPDGTGTGQTTTVPTPTVVGVPAVWRAGDLIKVAGSNFLIPTDGGSVTLRFVGQFEGEDVDWEIQASPRQANRVDFTFEANDAPNGFGMTTGRFTGKVTATNIGRNGKEAMSAAANVNVEVGPSIVVRGLTPEGVTCESPRTRDTLKGAILDLDFDVTGLGAGSGYTPITMEITWIDVNGEVKSITKNVSSGTSGSVRIDTGTPSPMDDESGTDDESLSNDIGISLQATDGDGNTINRRVVVTVHEELSVVYNGQTDIVEVMNPQVVTGCLNGGQTGNSFNYSESTSEGRSRGYSLSANFGINVWVLNLGFGFGVSESVSSGTGTGTGISHSVFPHWNGAFFRQTSKLRRTGQVIRWEDCGSSAQIGEAYVTDWVWAPGFNQKEGACPPFPEPLVSQAGVIEMPD